MAASFEGFQEVVEIESEDEDEALARALKETREAGGSSEADVSGQLPATVEEGQSLEPQEAESPKPKQPVEPTPTPDPALASSQAPKPATVAQSHPEAPLEDKTQSAANAVMEDGAAPFDVGNFQAGWCMHDWLSI